jgi:hypothetical protein
MKDLVDLLYTNMVNALHFEGDAVALYNFILEWKKAIEEARG